MEIQNNFVQIFDSRIKAWHKGGIEPIEKIKDNAGFRKSILLILHYNYLLWHCEDQARRKDVSDSKIASVKRKIDSLNQLRNDSIESADKSIIDAVKSGMNSKARMNSETPGSMIDRLSIISLKIFHMDEETKRRNAGKEHIKKCASKLKILKEQRADLASCYKELITDVLSGKRRIKSYYQFKMYNDPSTNPAVYKKA